MTLSIRNRVPGHDLPFHYQDAVIENEYVFVGRGQGPVAEVWLRWRMEMSALVVGGSTFASWKDMRVVAAVRTLIGSSETNEGCSVQVSGCYRK